MKVRRKMGGKGSEISNGTRIFIEGEVVGLWHEAVESRSRVSFHFILNFFLYDVEV